MESKRKILMHCCWVIPASLMMAGELEQPEGEAPEPPMKEEREIFDQSGAEEDAKKEDSEESLEMESEVPSEEENLETLPEIPLEEGSEEEEMIDEGGLEALPIPEEPLTDLGEDPAAEDVVDPSEILPDDSLPPMADDELLMVEQDGVEMLPEVVVTAEVEGGAVAVFGAPLKDNPLLKFGSEGTSVMGGQELRRKLGATLGETLASQPGVSASSYSPGVSRPIIRGFDGVRVRALRDGLGTMDLSADSPDHGVLIDLLMTEEVEIHRGPASLLFGNSAIGGAINTRTRYIPSVDRGERYAAMLAGGYETQGSGYHWATAAEMRGDFWALGFSASQRKAGDVSIPGKAWTDAYDDLVNPRVFVPGVGDLELENPDGKLANSFHERTSWSLGGRIGSEEGFSVGVSFQTMDQVYGIPYYFAGDSTDLFGDFSIDASLHRGDLEMNYRLDPEAWLDEVRFRFGAGRYQHQEIFEGRLKDEGKRFTETAFDKDALEGRLDFHFGEDAEWSGVFGAQFNNDDLAIERVVVPPPTLFTEKSRIESESLGLFSLNRWEHGPWVMKAGLRYDAREARYSDEFGSSVSASDQSFSQSLSATYDWGEVGEWDRLETTLSVSNIQRLPTAIERYAFYNSAPLGRFLIGGDLDGEELERETSTGLELSMRVSRGIFSSQLAAFYYRFNNFTYLEDQRGVSFVPTAQYVQTGADFYGLEGSVSWLLHEDPDGIGTFDLRLVGDVMRGRNLDRGDEPLPRMPAARLGFELTWESERWSAALETRYVFAQDRTAPFPNAELPTGDYLMANASVTWLPIRGSEDLSWSLKVNNLLNQEARNHTSFRKESNPLPGFGLRTEVRWVF
ncbi:MAG: iron complex outermembrane receptor protein [Akkermansiaceae bacterium]